MVLFEIVIRFVVLGLLARAITKKYFDEFNTTTPYVDDSISYKCVFHPS